MCLAYNVQVFTMTDKFVGKNDEIGEEIEPTVQPCEISAVRRLLPQVNLNRLQSVATKRDKRDHSAVFHLLNLELSYNFWGKI